MSRKKKITKAEAPPVENNIKPVPNKERLKQRLLTHYDLEEMFEVGRGTIYNWRQKGEFSFLKIGRNIYYYAEEIEKILEERKQIMVPGEGKKQKRK